MDDYKKMSSISDQEIHRFFNDEKSRIMSSIQKNNHQISYSKHLVKFAWVPVFLILIVFSFSFFLKPNTSDNRQVFQDNFLQISERLADLVPDTNVESLTSYSQSQIKELSESVLIFRQTLLDAYLKSDMDIVYDDYLEQLLTTKVFVEEIEDLVLNSSNWKLNELITPDDNSDITFKFLLSNDDYIVIEKKDGNQHSTIKLGIESDKLIYYEIHYSYDLTTDLSSNEESLMYNYFHFIEDKEAIFINSIEEQYSLRYSSIIDGSQFTISRGNQVVEGLSSSEGYSFHSYDSEVNATRYFQVIDDVIVSETYDVYSEHGLLYRYEDIDNSNDLINLYVNIVPALGWDYLYTADLNDNLEGVYSEEGAALFTGHVYYTYTPTYGYAAFKQVIDKSDLSDVNFKLTEYEMDLSEEKASINYLDLVRITDFEQAKEAFIVEGIDFFTEDIKSELYHYIDEDILYEVNEGNDKEPVTVSGDVEAFESEISNFEQIFSIEKTIVMDGEVTIGIYDENQLIQSQVTNQTIKYDMNNMYLETYSSNDGMLGTRVITLPYDGQLVSFTHNDSITEFEVVSDSSSRENFVEYLLSIYPELDLLQGVEHIKSEGLGVYKLTLNDDVFGKGINMDLVFQQMGISGLSESNIEAIYSFDQNHQSYDIELTITGLKTIEGDYDVTYKETTNVSIESFLKKDPLESVIFFRLPQSKDGIIFDSNTNQLNVYYINEGESWMRLYLDEGVYSSNIHGSSNSHLSYELLDANGHLIDDHSYRFEIDVSGYYYYKFNSSLKQRIDITLNENPYPINQDIYMDQVSDSIELTNQLETNTYSVFSNIEDTKRIIKLTLNPITNGGLLLMEQVSANDDYLDSCIFEEYENICYFLVAENTGIEFMIHGSYEGDFSFSYEYIYPPDTPGSIPVYDIYNLDNLPHVIMNEFITKIRFNFSVDTQAYYRFDKTIKQFGSDVDLSMALYNSNGERLRVSNLYISQELLPGDYYFEIYFTNINKDLIIVFPTID